jgi:hypothetical protein
VSWGGFNLEDNSGYGIWLLLVAWKVGVKVSIGVGDRLIFIPKVHEDLDGAWRSSALPIIRLDYDQCNLI